MHVTQVRYTNSSNECYQLATAALFTTHGNAPKVGSRFEIRGHARWLKMVPLNSWDKLSY